MLSSGATPQVDEKYHYKANVLKISDGDTLHVRARLPLDEERKMVLRLFGIDAVELHSSTGLAAQAWVTNWLNEHGTMVFFQVSWDLKVKIPTFDLYTVRDTKDKYGRYLAVVQSNGHDLATDLRAAGFEKPK